MLISRALSHIMRSEILMCGLLLQSYILSGDLLIKGFSKIFPSSTFGEKESYKRRHYAEFRTFNI